MKKQTTKYLGNVINSFDKHSVYTLLFFGLLLPSCSGENKKQSDDKVADSKNSPNAVSTSSLEKICEEPLKIEEPPPTSKVVGTGTPASCSEAALTQALTDGGFIKFNCGKDAHRIRLTKSLELSNSKNTTLDGEGKITIDGASAHRILVLKNSFEKGSPTVRLQRLTFENGKSSGKAHPKGLGADVEAGGGVLYSLGANIQILESVFRGNSCPTEGPDVGGGAIYQVGVGKMDIVRSQFLGNKCANGGALGSLAGEIRIYNSIFKGNEATGFGANWDDGNAQHGRGGNGGALVMDGDANDTLQICGTTVTENTAGAFGGAVFRTAYKTSQVTLISKSEFSKNSIKPDSKTGGAGALYLQGTQVTLSDSKIMNNSSTYIGGAWILDHGGTGATLTMTGSEISGNTSSGWGGTGLKIEGDKAKGNIKNSTIKGNTGKVKLAIEGKEKLTVDTASKIED